MEASSRAETPGSLALWFGLLAAPGAWSVQLFLGDQLFELGCAPGSSSPSVEGIGLQTIVVAVTILGTLLAVAGALVSYRCWAKTKADDSSKGQRAHWMAGAGVFVSALFLILIVQGYFPPLFLNVCESSL